MYKRSWLRWVSAYWELGGRCMQNTEMPWSEQPWWPCIYPKCVACIRKEFVSNAAKMHLMNTKWSGCSRQCWHLKGQQQQNQNKQKNTPTKHVVHFCKLSARPLIEKFGWINTDNWTVLDFIHCEGLIFSSERHYRILLPLQSTFSLLKLCCSTLGQHKDDNIVPWLLWF